MNLTYNITIQKYGQTKRIRDISLFTVLSFLLSDTIPVIAIKEGFTNKQRKVIKNAVYSVEYYDTETDYSYIEGPMSIEDLAKFVKAIPNPCDIKGIGAGKLKRWKDILPEEDYKNIKNGKPYDIPKFRGD